LAAVSITTTVALLIAPFTVAVAVLNELSQVLAAAANPPKLVVSSISSDVAFKPYTVSVMKSLAIRAGLSLYAVELSLGSNTFFPFTVKLILGNPPPNFSASNTH